MKKIFAIFSLAFLLSSCNVISYTPAPEKGEETFLIKTVKREERPQYRDEAYMRDSYNFIKNNPSFMTIDGVTNESINTIDKFQEAFDLKLLNQEIDSLYDGVITYQTPRGNKFVVNTSGDDIVSIDVPKEMEVKFPYGISTKNSVEENKVLLDERADFSHFFNDGKQLAFRASDDYYRIYYNDDGSKDISIHLDSDKSLMQDIVVREAIANAPDDDSGVIKLEGKEFKFPLKISDLEKRLGGKIEKATIDDYRAIGDDETIEDSYFDQYSGVIKTDNGTYIFDFIPTFDKDGSVNGYEDEVLSLKFANTSNFIISNDKILIDPTSIGKVYKDLQLDIASFRGEIVNPYLYLDDNTFLEFNKNYVRIVGTDKNDRIVTETLEGMSDKDLNRIFN